MKIFKLFAVAAALLIMVTACGPAKASDEELRQLDALRAEIVSLEKRASSLKEEIKKLEASIASKDAEIERTKKDLEAVNQP